MATPTPTPATTSTSTTNARGPAIARVLGLPTSIGRDPKLDVFASLALFEDLPRRRLRDLCAIFDLVDVEFGHELTTQGALGQEFFVIVNGVASVERDGEVIGAVGPGEIVGELAVLDTPTRTATVTARTDMRVLVAERRALAPLLGRMPILARRVADIRAARMMLLGVTAA
ncbi:MAG: CRP/FNR family cyclic AMP-dependent transcriptional regulator [Glaciecola sp.]|jgi:CRP/FNR family cyclic AMP-dependent transcriptional regulator